MSDLTDDSSATRPVTVTPTRRHGARWERQEINDLLIELRAGIPLEEIAHRHERTTGGIQSRLSALIPPTEGVDAADAYNWHRTHLDRILSIWQTITGTRLNADWHARFHARPEIADLLRYPDDKLERAGQALLENLGRLPLTQWTVECSWPGLGLLDLSWDALQGADEDTLIQVRELPAAAISGVIDWRRRDVLARRLGLYDYQPQSLETVGAALGVSATRARQLQEKAMLRLHAEHRLPWAIDHVRGAIKQVLKQAANAAIGTSECLLNLSEAALPNTNPRLAVRFMAILTKYGQIESRHLAAEVTSILARRREEEVQQIRQESVVGRATARCAEILDAVAWAPELGAPPDFYQVRAQRAVNEREHSGLWHAPKLGREVAYESILELRVIKLFDLAHQIAWYCEQPVAIPYRFNGKERTYYPDLLAVTNDQRCFLIEVKPRFEMATSINRVKFNAMRQYCAERGWGHVVTDGVRHMRQLESRIVDPTTMKRLTSALIERDLYWPDILRLRKNGPLTNSDIAAAVIQQGWDFQLGPYYLSMGPSRVL
ncbi:TnsA endonuclease N-terminal domain-containing protein [Streptosporangium soli]|nr:TnsA endonuclease N-terminal domain-containing protein [Streptosporangium sp. KLBMP 9127]